MEQNIVGVERYQDDFHYVSGCGAIRKEGDLDHSWATRLLPYIGKEELYEKIHLDRSWNAPVNKEAFSDTACFVPQQYHWEWYLRKPDRRFNKEGYALCGAAVNEKLLAGDGDFETGSIPDGISNTIFLGEVATMYRPWGDPINARDPGLGINTSPYGFGSPQSSGMTMFCFCDGSVRPLNKKIAPEVLKHLSTPKEKSPTITGAPK